MSDAICELAAWDSEFFGFPIARVTRATLSEASVREIDQWCCAQRVRCLYFQAGETFDPTTVELARASGYRLVNVNATLHQSLTATSSQPSLRVATAADIPALEDLAAQSHRDTRFFNDGRFAIERCEAMYRTWVRTCVEESDKKAVIVAEAEGALAGYSAVRRGASKTGGIELIAVAPSLRARGIGKKLVNASLAWMKGHHVHDAFVRTMAHNIAAQRLYQSCEFRVQATQLYFHKWFDESGGS